jgi:hypothetical protein
MPIDVRFTLLKQAQRTQNLFASWHFKIHHFWILKPNLLINNQQKMSDFKIAFAEDFVIMVQNEQPRDFRSFERPPAND